MSLRSSALFATALLAGTALADQAAPAERPSPHLFADHDPRCEAGDDACRRSAWVQFLKAHHLSELEAPPGGRAYRWLWIQGSLAEQVGYVELLVNADGGACVKSVWRRSPTLVEAARLAQFEAALGATEFTKLPAQDPRADTWLDYPPEQLMEVDAPLGYHFVHRVGGISESGIRDAGVLLEKLAQHPRRQACAQVR